MNREVASLVYWKNGMTRDDVRLILDELYKRGFIVTDSTQDYNPDHGGPVWYIP